MRAHRAPLWEAALRVETRHVPLSGVLYRNQSARSQGRLEPKGTLKAI